MSLSAAEVQEFLDARKVVRARVMEWEKPAPDRYLWTAPIEVDATRVGQLFLFVNPNLPRAWIFKLSLHGEEVLQWHVKPGPSGHNNPPDRPEGFDRKVREPEHEHVWIEGLDCRCARALEGFSTSDHRAIFEAFCEKANIDFQPDYVAPRAYEQLTL